MICEHGNIAPCVACDIDPLEAENKKLIEALKAAQKEALRGIKDAHNGFQVAAALGRVSAIVGSALDFHRKGEEK